MGHVGLPGIWHGKEEGADDFFESNSGIPTLPHLSGVMGTHGVYRHFSVSEQTALMIGEGKHGLWRVQENGMIREYRRPGMPGLRETDGDYNDANVLAADRTLLEVIRESYSPFLPEESWGGYKYPDEQYDDVNNWLNWIDLSIYHPKYEGKYEDHVPIDLPHYYCTMSGNEFRHAFNAWHYAVGQPRGNQVGPLGKRAGLDLNELYTNVLRFELFEDAGVWINAGEADSYPFHTRADTETESQDVRYRRVDAKSTALEVYLFERPFFNVPYLFVTAVLDHPTGSTYVRPNGPYWDQLIARGLTGGLNTVPEHYPVASVEGWGDDEADGEVTMVGLPVYGQHHPDQLTHGKRGGACPNRGGDWGRYPWGGDSGSGWPTQYQEITPICDAVVLDIKLWANLAIETWNDPAFVSGSAGYPGDTAVQFHADANVYGEYTDPWLVETGAVNPYKMELTSDGAYVDGQPASDDSRVTFRLDFGEDGFFQTAQEVPGLQSPTEKVMGVDVIVEPRSVAEARVNLAAFEQMKIALTEKLCDTCPECEECEYYPKRITKCRKIKSGQECASQVHCEVLMGRKGFKRCIDVEDNDL